MFNIGDRVVVSEDIINATDQCMTPGGLKAIAGQSGKIIDHVSYDQHTIEFDNGRGPYWVYSKYLSHEFSSFEPNHNISDLLGGD